MTGLVLVLSLLWVVPSICQDLNVPIESALLIRGEPVGFNLSHLVTHRRHKRAENVDTVCTEDQYKPRRKNYCCNKCIPGSKVEEYCEGRGQTTTCASCEPGTYMDTPNPSKDCHQCSTCLEQLGQVALSNCTRERDVVCGCPDGRFKTFSETTFKCVECNKCENGRVHVKCHDDKDTFCDCLHGYFLHKETKNCHPCRECDTLDCQGHCPPVEPVKKPKEAEVPIIVAGVSFAVAFLAASSYIIWKNRKRITCYLQKKTCHPPADIQGTIIQRSPLMESKGATPISTQLALPGYTTRDNTYVVQESTQSSSTFVLPDVTIQTSAPCTSTPLYTPDVLYKIIESIPVNSWREFVRRLGLSNHTIETCERDNKYYKEAQYAMLDIWINRLGNSGATRDCMFRVLRDMDLGRCVEIIEASF